MRCMFDHTAHNFHTFNNLLLEICTKMGCLFIDCFRDFLNADGSDHNLFLFRDTLHLNNRGIGVLCRIFKFVINRELFNPIIPIWHPYRPRNY